jgi:hypothetical protein
MFITKIERELFVKFKKMRIFAGSCSQLSASQKYRRSKKLPGDEIKMFLFGVG